MTKSQKTAYGGPLYWAMNRWPGFKKVSKHGYVSDTHGGRFVDNLVNKIGAEEYAKFSDETTMPVGTTVAKPSFTIGKDGKVTLGPLFFMEKMTKGFDASGNDWRYAMVMPGGDLFGLTGGKNSKAMQFCKECHAGAEDADYMLYLPDEARM
ncbi:MAG: cytochrome P460 family protein [Hyphomicrobiales bacterium]